MLQSVLNHWCRLLCIISYVLVLVSVVGKHGLVKLKVSNVSNSYEN